MNPKTSLEVVREMGNGTNLGNTMEAYGKKDLGTTGSPLDYEQSWGMPITTKEMIQGLVEAGFSSLRIPVAWTNMMDYEHGDYTIDIALLKRVQELVDIALDCGLYVIINDHWDGGWWSMFGSDTLAKRLHAMKIYTSIWEQVGEYFKDYPYHLIFESANEELGRSLNNKDHCPDTGNVSVDEIYQITNHVNQTFVNLIREQGGRNTDRFLLIAGYNTDFRDTCDPRYQMPSDPADNKLLLSVHYYTPWEYCGMRTIPRWGTKADLEQQNSLFQLMTTYTKQGYGIVIGEFGVALESDGTIKTDAPTFIGNVLDNCDLYGYVPMLWDTNHYYKREHCKIVHPTLRDLFQQRSYQLEHTQSNESIRTAAKVGLNKRIKDAPIEF